MGQIDWGAGPTHYPCLVATAPAQVGKVISCYVYPEDAAWIRGQMQKELDQITGEMQEKSAEIRGKADAEVIEIAAKGFSQSAEFYSFLRRLEAYKKSLKGDTRLILSTDNDFLRNLVETKEQ